MTNADAARSIRDYLGRPLRRGRPPHMKRAQLARIAEAFEAHPGDDRVDDDVDLTSLNSLELLFVEMAILQWYPTEGSRT